MTRERLASIAAYAGDRLGLEGPSGPYPARAARHPPKTDPGGPNGPSGSVFRWNSVRPSAKAEVWDADAHVAQAGRIVGVTDLIATHRAYCQSPATTPAATSARATKLGGPGGAWTVNVELTDESTGELKPCPVWCLGDHDEFPPGIPVSPVSDCCRHRSPDATVRVAFRAELLAGTLTASPSSWNRSPSRWTATPARPASTSTCVLALARLTPCSHPPRARALAASLLIARRHCPARQRRTAGRLRGLQSVVEVSDLPRRSMAPASSACPGCCATSRVDRGDGYLSRTSLSLTLVGSAMFRPHGAVQQPVGRLPPRAMPRRTRHRLAVGESPGVGTAGRSGVPGNTR
jgi:hypothetical protein